MVALLAAVLLGGVGGYLVRGLSVPAVTTIYVPTSSVTVKESPPYSQPAAPQAPYQTTGPDGRTVPI